MAEHGTRKTTTDRLEDAIARLTNSQASINERYVDLSAKVDSILEHLRLHDSGQHTTTPAANQHHQRNHVKLDIPRFDGRDPLGWIFKITQLFQYQNTPEEDRITLASLYLDGAALSWYQWMHSNGLITSWTTFLEALESRFAPTFYNDPKGALFKLMQRGTVNEYLTEFERLANRVIGLPPPFLLSCFISGLNPDIRREVLALQPISLLQATALAKLQEEKLREKRAPPHRILTPPSSSTNHSTDPVNKPKPPYVRRTPEEMAFRREKGLCYNCDEKWNANHRCKGRIMLLIADEPPAPTSVEFGFEEEPVTTVSDSPELSSNNACSHISLHALSGLPSSETFRIFGVIKHARLTLLIDSGSTHNFLQPRIAQFLRLPTQATHPLHVLVGNGSTLACDQTCPDVPVTIQGHSFIVNFHLLEISGADAVLGIDWLKKLGPVTTDYTTFIMNFHHLGHDISLKADVTLGPEPASAAQLRRLIQTGSASAFFHLSLIPDNKTEPPPAQHSIPSVASLLIRYHHLFQPPSQLPPPRSVVHRIPLNPSSAPINVRPYRYPHFQKNEIEKQVSDLLSAGLIRPSTSPYSSPVLLVKKKDGTWRLCVDFRALNSVTIRDRFPIPTIEELLDELGHASWFSKLDLRQGFHQILMHDEDVQKTAFRTHHGHFEYLVMPFGLCNAPSTFQSAMNQLLQPYLRRFATVFFDDILVYSDSLQTHLEHLEIIFNTLLQGQF